MQYERTAAILQISQEELPRFMDLQNRGRAFILHGRTKNKNQSLNNQFLLQRAIYIPVLFHV